MSTDAYGQRREREEENPTADVAKEVNK